MPRRRLRRATTLVPILAAIALDLAALVALLSPGTEGLSAIALLVLRAFACAAVALAGRRFLSAALQRRAAAIVSLFAVIEFAVPLLGPMLIAATRIAERTRRTRTEAPVSYVDAPEYSVYRESANERARSGRLRARLTNRAVAAAARLRTLLAIQDAPARVTADILRDLLADPSEDIRLLAYGMLDGKEKAISHRILAEEAALEAAETVDARFGHHKRIAELYWELVYQRLVQGDMKRHAGSRSERHARDALAIRDDDAGLWLLLARIALDGERAADADVSLQQAAERGLSRAQLVPYLAEAAFMQRRFERIGPLFAELPGKAGTLRLAAVQSFWSDR